MLFFLPLCLQIFLRKNPNYQKHLHVLEKKIEKKNIKVLPIFDLIAKVGNIPERDMFNTFNMGVGMSITVAKEDVEKALEIFKANGEDAYVIGEIVKDEENKIIRL